MLEPKEIAQDAGEAFSWLNIRTVLAVESADLLNSIDLERNLELDLKARPKYAMLISNGTEMLIYYYS